MRIAIRDTTDSHTVGFFDNKAGIKFKSAEMTQFLKGACSYVSIKYRSKDVEKVRAGCKLAFRHKGKDYWLTINEFNKQGTEVEITAYSLSLEANKEKRGAYKASSAMSIVDYFSVFDPEKSFEIGINEVSDKKLTLEWTGTDTVLARLYSIANSFDAELEFVTELNPNYSLKRHVVNIYRSGNLGGDSTGRPVRVGTELKVLGFNSNINDLYTAIDVTGKDGLRLPDKTIKDAKGEVQFFSKNGRLYAPQARDKFPSNKVNTQDGYILAEAKTTDYTNQEALFGYALSEMKKHCDVQIEYSTEGAVKGSVGDTKTLIDAINFEPTLYVQARITEQTEDLETGKSLKTTFSNFKRTSSQLSNDLTKKIEELAKSAVPYRIVMVTSNGTSFKNGTGQSIVSPKLFKGDVEITDATYRFNFNNNTVAGLNYTVNASAVNGTSVLKIDAYVGNDVVASDELTFINVNDGLNGSNGRGITSTEDYYLVSASKTGITSATTGWVKSTPQVATATNKYHWHYHVDIYSDGTRKETVPAIIGIYGDPGKDGSSSYTHVAYANKSTDVLVDAMTTFAVPASFSGSTLTSTKISGGYKFTSTGGNSYTKQVVGFSGTTGKNVYTYLVIKNTHATNDIVVSFNGIGAVLNENFSNVTVKPGQTYVDYRPAICRDTYNFLQISIGSTAISNDLSYEIYDYALYNTNPFINFSLDVNPNCRFRGEYQDNNQTASTDPTKYKWSDLRGTVDVGGRNYLTKSNTIRDAGANKLGALSVRDTETPNGLKVTGNSTKDGTVRIYNVINSDGWWTVSFDIKGSQSLAVNVDVDICDQGQTRIWTNATNTYERKSISVNVTKYSTNPSVYHFVDFANFAYAHFFIDNIQIEKGNIATDYSPAHEDIDEKIDSNQALTQAQMLALEERSALARDNAIAEAIKNTISEVEAKWQTWYNLNTADEKQKVANDIASLFERVAEFKENLGEASAKFSFINNETLIGEEGVAIGDKEGKAKLFLSNDSISFVTNGVAQMTLTGDTLTIKNGLFTERIQIGNYVEEVYDRNPLYNVIRPIKYS
ncbi:phage tail protein [Streptococcus uberis]|uniref:phage tail protein n=1 Tax=Streptococcus uberis TaxID=1349 RepID=UPI00193A39C6|nr:phage tail protein [Streptococcus uberis]